MKASVTLDQIFTGDQLRLDPILTYDGFFSDQ